MSSYVIQKQSRGVGAVAAEDLGVTSRASGSPVKERCPTGQSWDKIEQMCQPTRTALKARLRTTAPAVSFVQGRTGKILPKPTKPAVADFRYPRRAFLSATTPRNTGTATAAVPVISRPIDTEPAGVLPGKPPATARPVRVASAQTAAAAKHQAQDQILDMGIEEASFQIPQITGNKNSKVLIYGGLGLGALALLYLMTRKG
jgi:hypothetical protein